MGFSHSVVFQKSSFREVQLSSKYTSERYMHDRQNSLKELLRSCSDIRIQSFTNIAAKIFQLF